MVRKQSKRYDNGTIGEVIYNPTSVKMMAKQVVFASDEYIAGKVSEKTFKELILYYATKHGKMLFSRSGDINPTILNRIGKKRTALVNIMLEGFQATLF